MLVILATARIRMAPDRKVLKLDTTIYYFLESVAVDKIPLRRIK